MTFYAQLKKANLALTHGLGLVRALGLVKKDVGKFAGKAKLVNPPAPPASPASAEPKMSAVEQEKNTQRLMQIFEDASKTEQ